MKTLVPPGALAARPRAAVLLLPLALGLSCVRAGFEPAAPVDGPAQVDGAADSAAPDASDPSDSTARSWTFVASPLSSTVQGIAPRSATTAWAVTFSGSILAFDGSKWVTHTQDVSQTALRAVWTAGQDEAWAVGDAGVMARYSGGSWQPYTSPTGEDLEAIWGTGATNIYAVGDGGTILHYDGVSWSAVTQSPTTQHLRGVWGLSGTSIYVAGYNGTVLTYSTAGWTASVPGPMAALYAVWGATASDLWVTGENGATLHYAAGKWTSPAPVTTRRIEAIQGTSSSDIWGVGQEGLLVHYGGAGWSVVPTPKIPPTHIPANAPAPNLLCLWVMPSGEIWVGGQMGTLLRYR